MARTPNGAERLLATTVRGAGLSAAILWMRGAARARRVELSVEGEEPYGGGDTDEECPEAVRQVASIVARYLREPFDFDAPWHLLDLTRATPFQRRALAAARRIPIGRVARYADVAAAMGRPGCARAVGQAMAWNPFPLIIPCHRIVAADGSLGGFSPGPPIKKLLLARERMASNPADR